MLPVPERRKNNGLFARHHRFCALFSSIPIAYALFGATISYFTFLDATSPAHLVFQRIITSTQSFPLLAIPFFIMAGSIMNYAGISDKLMKFTDVLMGHMTGGLAQVNVLLSLADWAVFPAVLTLMLLCRVKCLFRKWKSVVTAEPSVPR